MILVGSWKIFAPLVLILFLSQGHVVFGNHSLATATTSPSPFVHDNGLKLEIVSNKIEFPTGMAFLGPDDILVLEKNTGAIKRIVNGEMLPEPLLRVPVQNSSERGLLGIAISNNTADRNDDNGGSRNTIFLYFTEEEDDEDTTNYNRVYGYELIENELIDDRLVLNLPGEPGGRHNGGVILIGPDNNLYVAIGDVNSGEDQARNNHDTDRIEGLAGIFRVKQDGSKVESILGEEHPLDMYYAYGIRNSFGMDFDPITGNLWNTENGDDYDEINLVEPGFNSGFSIIEGLSYFKEEFSPGDDLLDFDGNGKYSDPEFVWNNTVAPTALKFLNSDKLGKQYMNDMFVGDFNNGYIYHFDLNENRTELSLDGLLNDKISANRSELEELIWAENFGGITDIEVGPDGYLYVLSLGQTDPQDSKKCDAAIPNPECGKYSDPIKGSLFRIMPLETSS